MIAGLLRSARRMRALLAKEFLQLLRDPRMRFVLVAPPLIELLLFGYAATFDVRHADVAVVNHDTSQTSRELLAAIRASGHYTLNVLPDMRSASAAVDRNEARVILQIPADLGERRQVQVIADGSDPNSAQLIAGEWRRPRWWPPGRRRPSWWTSAPGSIPIWKTAGTSFRASWPT
jgi:ABC-2 type transport system permease protein